MKDKYKIAMCVFYLLVGSIVAVILTNLVTLPVTTTTTQVTEPQEEPASLTYVLNTNTKKIHYPSCPSVDQMKETNKSYTDDYAGAIAQGYVPCKNCNPTG